MSLFLNESYALMSLLVSTVGHAQGSVYLMKAGATQL
jgi:hypothetical protein